jgi:hypothetical protein
MLTSTAAISVSQNLVCKTVPQPSRSAELIRVVTILSAISFPVIILRIYSRFTVAYIWWDDWAIVAAGVSYTQTNWFDGEADL